MMNEKIEFIINSSYWLSVFCILVLVFFVFKKLYYAWKQAQRQKINRLIENYFRWECDLEDIIYSKIDEILKSKEIEEKENNV
jgi:hypothetical protein